MAKREHNGELVGQLSGGSVHLNFRLKTAPPASAGVRILEIAQIRA